MVLGAQNQTQLKRFSTQTLIIQSMRVFFKQDNINSAVSFFVIYKNYSDSSFYLILIIDGVAILSPSENSIQNSLSFKKAVQNTDISSSSKIYTQIIYLFFLNSTFFTCCSHCSCPTSNADQVQEWNC